jgi:hypothetical protein
MQKSEVMIVRCKTINVMIVRCKMINVTVVKWKTIDLMAISTIHTNTNLPTIESFDVGIPVWDGINIYELDRCKTIGVMILRCKTIDER